MCTCFPSSAAQPVPSSAWGDGEDCHHPHPWERRQDQGSGGDPECVSGGDWVGDTFWRCLSWAKGCLAAEGIRWTVSGLCVTLLAVSSTNLLLCASCLAGHASNRHWAGLHEHKPRGFHWLCQVSTHLLLPPLLCTFPVALSSSCSSIQGAEALVQMLLSQEWCSSQYCLVFSVALNCKAGEENRDAWKGLLQFCLCQNKK